MGVGWEHFIDLKFADLHSYNLSEHQNMCVFSMARCATREREAETMEQCGNEREMESGLRQAGLEPFKNISKKMPERQH